MTYDGPPNVQCPSCGQPLTSEEMRAGATCSKCSEQPDAPNAHMGLAPGDRWRQSRGKGSLGEIGSWQPGLHEPRRTDQYDGNPSSNGSLGPAANERINDPRLRVDAAHYSPPTASAESSETGDNETSASGWDGRSHAQGNAGTYPAPGQYGGPGVSAHSNPAAYDPHLYPGAQSNQLPPPGFYVPSGQPLAGYEPYDPSNPNPDRPPWGVGTGVGVWVFSVAVIFLLPLVTATVWFALAQMKGVDVRSSAERLSHDPSLVFILVLSEGVAHLLTIAVLWAVVTKAGARPFWATLGWRWSGVSPYARYGLVAGALVSPLIVKEIWSALAQPMRLGLILGVGIVALVFFLVRPTLETWSKIGFVVGLVAAILIIDIVLSNLLPQSKGTDFEEMLKTSKDVRVLISIMAVFTAPFVEEGVYRGVLYGALRRVTGLGPSVAIVASLFAGVHFLQYWGAWSSIASISILSVFLTLVRARSKSILPCIAIHTVFNLVESVFIVLHKY